MSMARTARRRRKQMIQNNDHLSGMRVPRYGRPPDSSAAARRFQRKQARWQKTGSAYAGGGKK